MDNAAPQTSQQRARRPVVRVCGAMLSVLLLCFPAAGAIGQMPAKSDPARVEAAFLRNFAHYVTWPAHAFSDDQAAWRICILGKDPFGAILDHTLNGRTEQGRAFEVLRANSLAELPACQIVYVVDKAGDKRRRVLAELRERPILTVGAAPDFLREGGIIQFQVTNHVQFSINLDQARSASLSIQTKMLEVAREVIENGVVRRQR